MTIFGGLLRQSFGAIVEGNSASKTGSAVSTLTWSHAVASGSNRLLLVRIGWLNSTANVTGVTYGGVAMTSLSSAQNGTGTSQPAAAVYFMLSPPVGSASVQVKLDAAVDVAAMSSDFAGVSLTAPFGTAVVASGSTSPPTTTVTGLTSDLFVDIASTRGSAGTSAAAGSGQNGSYAATGSTSSDVLVMASTKAGATSATLSWNYTTGTPPWISVGVPIHSAGQTISGAVFEDINYGGGPGRSLPSSNGTGVSGATVELYDSTGKYVRSSSTASDGSYSFTDLSAGNYFVRVASSTVLSQRAGSVGGLLPVLTYRTTGTSGSALAVIDNVGGNNPAKADPGVATTGAALSTSTYVYSAGLAGTAHAIASVTVGNASITGVDFGFNFDTVANANASGQGSLAQALANANALGGDASLAQDGRAPGIENLVFMISNGTTGAGLRSAYNYFSGGVATITPAAALPTISNPLVLDAQTQPGFSANPVIELNGTGAGNNNGLVLSASGSIARGFIVNRWAYAGVRVTANATVQGNWLGTSATGLAAAANGQQGLELAGGAATVGGTGSNQGNIISGNTGAGIWISGGSGHVIQANVVGLGADRNTRVANAGNSGIEVYGTGGNTIGGTATGAGNLIAGNSGKGVVVAGSATGNAIRRNRIYGNGGIGIDLGNNGVTANDGAKTNGSANLLMDSPVFTAARASGTQLLVAGYVGSAASQSTFANATVEIFSSDSSASGYGGGKTYLGTVRADASGNFGATLTMPLAAVAIGTKLTGTATDGSGNTSEFGANFSGLIVDLVVNDNGDAADASAGDGYCATAGGACTLRAAIAELNAWSGLATPLTIAFAIPGCTAYGAAACTITPTTALPTLGKPALLDGSTQAGFSTSSYEPVIELNGAGAPANTTGLVVSANNATVRGLAINRFPANGITLSGSGGTLAGLRIGLAAHSAATAANGGAGILITGSGATVGSVAAADANILSGNTAAGVSVAASGAVITGNYIGSDSAGTAGLGNGSHGIVISTSGLSGIAIGGNTLANNGGAGVAVTAASQVQIMANAMSGNGGIGIDLGGDGVSTNTGSTSASLPNRGMNYPVIAGAGVGSTAMTVYGSIGTNNGQSVFAGARVEFFKAAPDGSGYGEGLVYLGFLAADANGRFAGSVAFNSGQLAVGDVVTATATDSSGNTSEFGPNRTTTTTVAALLPSGFNAFDSSTAAGALTGPITSKTAGALANFAVIALDNSGGNLHAGFTGTVTLTWVDARNDSGTASGSCRSSWTDTAAAGSAAFSNNNRVTVSLAPPPSSTRVMRLRMSYTANGSTTIACSNDAFAALPASLGWVNASDADSATAGTTRVLANTGPSGGVVHKAGRPFTVRAQALDATGALMSGYDGSPVLAAAGCLLPSGCTAARLTAANVAAIAGAYTHSTVSYADVGALQLQLTDSNYADVDASDTAAGLRTLNSGLLSVGRFIPDAYLLAVSANGQLATANSSCMASGAGATFMGQAFGWATPPQVTVTAVNAAGATTQGWTGSLMKLNSASVLSSSLSPSGAGRATFSASYGSVTVSDLGSGQARLAVSGNDRFLLELASGAVQDSVTPNWAWALSLSDASEAALAGNPTLNGSAGQGSVAFNSGSVFHTGRLWLSPAHGDVRTGIHALVQLQRYTAAGWVTLTDDQGCVAIQNQNVGVESPTGVFATLGGCVAPLSRAVTTKGGRAWLDFPGTPAGAPGRLTLRLAGAAATGSSCTAAGAAAALVSLTPTWLLGGISGLGPSALATWGKPQRDATLRRETW